MITHLIILIAVTLLLYFKTYKFHKLIDDEVPRSGYLKVLTVDLGHTPASWYEAKRSIGTTITNVGTMLLCVWAIYVMWGFYPALLFAVFPLNVSGVAWTTGNYYMSTCWLNLVVHYFCTHLGLLGLSIGVIFYFPALYSTLSSIPYAFISPLIASPVNAVLIIPLGMFIFGKKFRSHIKRRIDLQDNANIKAGQIDPWRFFLVIKIITYYAVLSLFPSRLGFFHDCSRFISKLNPDRIFWLSAVCLSLFMYWMWSVDWRMAIWWFLMIGLYSQYTNLGMFVAERYTYSANVAFCVILANFLPEKALLVIASLWFYHSRLYCNTHRHNMNLFANACAAFPHTSENFNNLGCYYLERREYHKAIEPFLMAEKLDPIPTYNIFMNLSLCYKALAMYNKSYHYAQRASIYCPKDMQEKLRENIEWLEEKIKLTASHQKTLKRMGLI